ncbi:MAG: peptide ABC transporter substrate-binding protein, partial [Deltaproteobacteria bacterium]|nr:peptide ABC transporter substrate-binding protein [Deltaproteobacteria bacterium]
MKKLGLLSVLFLLISGSLWAAVATNQILNFALTTEPPQLNSMKATDTSSSFVLGHILEGLTRYGKSDDIVPGVA